MVAILIYIFISEFILKLHKCVKENIKSPYSPYPVFPVARHYVTMVCFRTMKPTLVPFYELNCRLYLYFTSFKINVPFPLFQDPIQNVTFSQSLLYVSFLLFCSFSWYCWWLKSTGQVLFGISLKFGFCDVFLWLDRVSLKKKSHHVISYQGYCAISITFHRWR